MSTAQQAKVSVSSCIIDLLLAFEAKHKRGIIVVATEDLQALADDYKRLQQGLQTMVNSNDRYYVGITAMQDCAEILFEGGTI